MSTRGRRIRRGLGLALAGLVLVVLVGSLILRVTGQVRLERAIERFEARHGSTDVLELPHRALPPKRQDLEDHENAATWFRAAAAAIVWSREDEDLVARTGYSRLTELDASELKDLRRILDEQGAVISLVRRGAACVKSNWWIPYKDGLEAELPNFLDIMWTARLMDLEARVLMLDERHPEALESIETMIALSRSLRDEDVLIVGLIGIAIQRMAWELAIELVTDPEVDSSILRAARSMAQGKDARERIHAQIRYDAGATVRWDSSGDAHLSFLERVLGPVVLGHFFASYLDAVNESFSICQEPAAKWPSIPDARDDESFMSIPHPRALARNLTYAIPRAQLVDAQELLVMTAIDLRVAAGEEGAYPPTLETVADPLTGQPLVYESLEGGGASLSLAPGARQAIRGKMTPAAAENALLAIELPKP